MGLTDLLLVGFFLGIGLQGLPNWQKVAVACLLVLLLPFKAALFFALLTRFHLRTRTAWMGGLSLGSYSEFGLIVVGLAHAKGWMPEDWLVVVAIALASYSNCFRNESNSSRSCLNSIFSVAISFSSASIRDCEFCFGTEMGISASKSPGKTGSPEISWT